MSLTSAPPRAPRRGVPPQGPWPDLPGWQDDPFFAEYFRRIDPRVADSFTAEQRAALKLMFGGRAPGHHWVDLRRSLPWFGRRIYLVLLLGRERRSLERLRREGVVSRSGDAFVYCIALAILLTPFAAGLYMAKSALGVDLINDGGLHSAYEGLLAQFRLLFSN